MPLRPIAIVVATALAPVPALAQSFGDAAPTPVVETPDLIFTLRGGVAATPDYFGSDEYTLGPDFGLRFGYVNIPGWQSFGSTDRNATSYGFAPRVSFRYIDERSSDDNSELEGLEDVDTTLELGGGLIYRSYNFDAVADIRYGFGGSESFVSELRADLKVHPSDRLVLRAGPRVLMGTDDYVSTYFGVSEEEAAVSQFDAYEGDGGLVSAGIELGASYDVSENWGVEGAVTYGRYVGDAEDSPIVEEGDRDQYGIRLGVTRRITLDF